jgi:hypothetical protein
MSNSKKHEPEKPAANVVRFANGSTLAFGPTDEGEHYEGTSYEHVVLETDAEGRVLDELAPFTKEDYERVLRHIKDRGRC